MKAVVAAFNQEKALVGAFSVITNLRMELFQALAPNIWSLQRDRDWRRTKPDATHFISILLFVDPAAVTAAPGTLLSWSAEKTFTRSLPQS